jgi:trk system potassium uptake protein TrkH
MIISSFLIVDIIGFVLLMLPISASTGKSIGVTNALFTTVSSTCVTGLVVFDTASTFSSFGRAVIIALIQVGGLGLVTITTFFISVVRRKVGLRTRVLVQESSGSFSFVELPALLKSIVTLTFVFEFIGFILFSTQFVPMFGWKSGMAKAGFQAISSFCNAGFDLMGDTAFGPYSSLTGFTGNPVVIFTTAFLVICGGLGFIVWRDLLSYFKNRKLNVHTRITLIATFCLLLIGTLFIFTAEWGNTGEQALGSLPAWQRPISAFFQSVTMRTAGFNTINMSNLLDGTKLFCVALMFIGAGSGSTGGGIKVSTFMLLIYSVYSEIRGRSNIVIRKHQIARVAVQRAIAIFVMGLGLVLVLSVVLCFTESAALASGRVEYLDLLFESVSAFGTVGVSAANTSQLTTASQMCMIPIMFIGRVGPVTFAVSLALREPKEYSNVFPEGKIHIG